MPYDCCQRGVGVTLPRIFTLPRSAGCSALRAVAGSRQCLGRTAGRRRSGCRRPAHCAPMAQHPQACASPDLLKLCHLGGHQIRGGPKGVHPGSRGELRALGLRLGGGRGRAPAAAAVGRWEGPWPACWLCIRRSCCRHGAAGGSTREAWLVRAPACLAQAAAAVGSGASLCQWRRTSQLRHTTFWAR